MEPVAAHLVPRPKGNEDKTGQAQGQTGYIDKGIDFLPFEGPQCDSDVIYEHDDIPQLLTCLLDLIAIFMPSELMGLFNIETTADVHS